MSITQLLHSFCRTIIAKRMCIPSIEWTIFNAFRFTSLLLLCENTVCVRTLCVWQQQQQVYLLYCLNLITFRKKVLFRALFLLCRWSCRWSRLLFFPFYFSHPHSSVSFQDHPELLSHLFKVSWWWSSSWSPPLSSNVTNSIKKSLFLVLLQKGKQKLRKIRRVDVDWK